MKSKLKEFFLLKFILPIADKVMGTRITYWLKKITFLNSLTEKDVIAWQNKHLQRFIQHTYQNTVYYRNLFDSLGIKPNDIQSIADLKKIPPIDKDIIRKNHADLIPANINKIPHKKGRTGGTTGMPLHYLYDEDTWGYITAAKIYAWKTMGYRYGDKFVTIGSSSLFPTHKKSWKHALYFFIRSGIPLNGMNISDEIADKYVKTLIKKKVKYIYGYAASIYLLTKYIQRKNIDMSQIRGVFTTSEVLTSEYRKLMEEIYQCRVMDCYGARDAGITAYEIFPGKYHVGYNLIAEIDVSRGSGASNLMATNMLNYSFPLIRYKPGDEVCLQKNDFTYNGQVITKIIGRTSDIMYFDNGHSLTATGYSIMIRDFNVEAFTMRKINGTKLKVEIQPKITFTSNEKKLLYNTLKKHVGKEVEVDIENVDSFEPLKNGKRQYWIT